MDNVRPIRPRRPQTPGRGIKVPRRVVIVIGIAIVILVVAARLLGMYVDWLWFREIALRVVFWNRFWAQLVSGLVFTVVAFVIVYANVEIARRLSPRFKAGPEGDLVEAAGVGVRRLVTRVGLAVALVAALVAGVGASSRWLTFLKALHATPFGQKDPVFHHDLGFYVFSLPAWHFVQTFVQLALVGGLIAAAIVHFVLGGIAYSYAPPAQRTGRQLPRVGLDLRLDARAVAHLSAVLGLVFVLSGVGQLFKAWDLLYSTSGVVFGAGYTDVHARLPLIRVLMIIAFLLAAALFVNVWRRRQYWPLAIAVWLVALIALSGVWPAIMQSLIVNPNQLGKERPYIVDNITATRAAYDLQSIKVKQLPMRTDLTSAQLATNGGTIGNVRLWDPDTLVTSYRQLQELRPYYSFLDADVDRYNVGGVYTQTMLSPRELNIGGLPSNARTWVNEHITYTHGFGVALSAVNQVTADGSPDFLVQDVPPRSAPGLEITQPRIYYGEMGTDYSLVKTRDQEFDYPGAGGDVYRSYDGSGGIGISSALTRLAFCVHFSTIKFFTASAITGGSRIIIRNNIRDRLATAAPFLSYDSDPYMVIVGGRLYWIVDAYTTTTLYPYSTPQDGVNYIRNSVKAVIDAYNGSVTLYAFDPSDPILRTYEKIFPGMFTALDKMPQDLRVHLRYPEGYFNTQARVYATYHVQDPEVLYNKGDQWDIPDNVALSGPGQPMAAYYVVMRLPGAQKEEFLLMLPFVPNGRSNMISWLGAQSDAPNYGQAVNYEFTKSTTIYGPSQVEAAVNQDPKISSQLTLWGQVGSTAIMGNLLVVPIEDSLLYVQPLYLQAATTKLPQLKEVIVFYRSPSQQSTSQAVQRQVVAMEPTLGQALADVFGVAPPGAPTPSPSASGGPPASPAPGLHGATLTQLIQRANQEFDAAQKAQQTGDWAAYGRQLKALKQTLAQLQTVK
jgi:uncharacterized membrane protein (UPF0182 family)